MFSNTPVHGDITFTAGDYYSTDGSLTITQYNPVGDVVGSTTLPSTLGSQLRGIDFGSDNLLYATIVQGSGFAVLALDSSGTVAATYSMPSVYLAGDGNSGKITLDGQYIYVAGGQQLTRFLMGDTSSGTAIYTANGVTDVNTLPSGDLLVASSYQIDEVTNTGAFVRTIPLNGDDNVYTNITGIASDPATNHLFVWEYGHTGFAAQLMRLDLTTGVLQKNIQFFNGNDLFLTESGQLLVGSSSQNPAFFTTDLGQIGGLNKSSQSFVTEFVPEPPAWLLLIIGIVMLSLQRMSGRAPRYCCSLRIDCPDATTLR